MDANPKKFTFSPRTKRRDVLPKNVRLFLLMVPLRRNVEPCAEADIVPQG